MTAFTSKNEEGIDVGDKIELVALDKNSNFHSLRNGMIGKVVGVCVGYCLWVKFPNYAPADQPSTKFGFPIYFDEAILSERASG